MKEIVKHINDTNASYRTMGAGDAKNTDLFLDNEHFELFKDCGEQITVRFDKENLSKAILFIASILPRKYDCSATHTVINYSVDFVLEQLAILDGFFMVDGKRVSKRTQVWNARKDVEKKNGEIDSRFYFNGLICDVLYSYKGMQKQGKFTLRNYLAGAYSDIKITKADDGIFDIVVTNAMTPNYEGIQENIYNEDFLDQPLQQIFYGAPGTGKSHEIKKTTDLQPKENVFRTTFHPDSDYSTFVGCYKPTMQPTSKEEKTLTGKDEEITYKFVPQAFLKAYIRAYQTTDPVYLVIEEINRGNCAQIFGDLFQLLDREDGVSEYPIKADDDLAKYLRDTYGEDFAGIANGELCLPSNLYIWATMNTSDQSLFPIDSAFKRRWEWQYMPIEDAGKNWKIRVNNNEYDWYAFLTAINHEILALTHSEDKQLGYFFAKADAQGVIDAAKLVNKVYFYLWTDVFKDYETENNSVFKKADSNDTIAYKDFFVSGQKINEEVAEQLLKNLKLNTPEAE